MEFEIPIYKFALREDLKEEKQFLPTRGEPKATGWDVRAAFEDRKTLVLHPFQCAKIPLGFRGFCPDGWWYKLCPRSSTFAKKNLHCLYGVIDEAYEGSLVFACQYIPEPKYTSGNLINCAWMSYCDDNSLEINFGDAIGQIIPVRRQEMRVQEVSNEEYDWFCKGRGAERGAGGFGSTGR